MNSSPSTLPKEEQEQLIQTIEMFEVIVQANPNDSQSMEILKDAFFRLGQMDKMLSTSRRLGETYMELGHFSSAVLEFESVLEHDPDNPEVMASLGEVEERMKKAGVVRTPNGEVPIAINLDFQGFSAATEVAGDGGTLITTAQTLRHDSRRSSGPARVEDLLASLTEDGSESLAKFLIQHKLADETQVISARDRVQRHNRGLAEGTFAASLLDELVRLGSVDLETLLSGMLDRSKFAYIPLEYYEVDRQVVKMLPEAIMFSRLIVPFDVISRTIMIATANPFDSRGKDAVQQMLDYNIQWHLASPRAVVRALAETFRISLPSDSLESTGSSSSGLRLAEK